MMIWGGNCTFCKLQHQPSFISSFPFDFTLIPFLRQNAVISGYNGLLKVTLVFPEINSSTPYDGGMASRHLVSTPLCNKMKCEQL